MFKLTRWLFAFLCFVLMLLACGSDATTGSGGSGSGGAASGGKTVQSVGPAGGTVTSAEGVTLVIPPGALSANQEITVEAIDASRLGPEWAEVLAFTKNQKIYELGPTGLTFALPIRVTVSLSPLTKESNGTIHAGFDVILSSSAGAVYPLENAKVTAEADGKRSISADMAHFSPLFEATPTGESREEFPGYVFGANGPAESKVGQPFTLQLRVEPASPDAKLASGRYISSVPETGAIGLLSEKEGNLGSVGGEALGADVRYVCQRKSDGENVRHFVTLYPDSLPVLTVKVWGVIFKDLVTGTFDELPVVEVYLDVTHNCVDGPKTLTVALTGTGKGSVVSSPAGISCTSQGGTCTKEYTEASVSLSASPEPGSKFVGWSGAVTGNGPTITVPMDGAQTVTAEFRKDGVLSVALTGTGTGTVTSVPSGISCFSGGGVCTKAFSDSSVTLVATPSGGSYFAGWSGAVTGTATSISVPTDADKSVTAEFRTNPVLTVSVVGNGTVLSDPAGITCKPDCILSQPPGTKLTLSFLPDDDQTYFVGWSGDLTGNAPDPEITLDTNKNVTATFAPIDRGGDYVGTLSKVADTPGHDPFVFNAGAGKAASIRVAQSVSTLTLTGLSGFAPSALPALVGTLVGNAFTASGTGTIAGLSNVKVEATGTANGTTLSIQQLVVGGPGGTLLPGGQPITYGFSGTK